MPDLDLAIRGGTVATASDTFRADVGVRDGRIVAVAEVVEGAAREIDASGLLVLPGGISETEILLAYGGVHFASKMGQLAGNHFLTIVSGTENLPKLGRMVLWKGAHDIRFDAA